MYFLLPSYRTALFVAGQNHTNLIAPAWKLFLIADRDIIDFSSCKGKNIASNQVNILLDGFKLEAPMRLFFTGQRQIFLFYNDRVLHTHLHAEIAFENA